MPGCLTCPPITNPTTCAELQQNRNALHDMWKVLNCLKDLTVKTGRKCYEVKNAVDVGYIDVPKAEVPNEPEYCNVMLFWNGVFYQKEGLLDPSPLDWTIEDGITYWRFNFNEPVGTEDDKCNLYLIIDLTTTFGDILCSCDELEPDC